MKTSKELAHDLVDLVFEAKDKGLDITLELRPLVCIGVRDLKGCSKDDGGIYLTVWTGDTQNYGLKKLVEQTREYINNPS